MKSKHGQCLIGALVLSFLVVEPVFAGPGGYIAKAAFETVWGRILMGMLTIFFLPLILWIVMKEALASRRVRRDLAFMAARDSRFQWLKIQQRIKECYQRVHAGWESEDLSDASDWMTDWYWQNQQMVHLNRWEKEGLINVCKVKKIKSVKPLLFMHYNNDNDHEDSVLSVSICANVQDYLQNRSTQEVVEGSKKFKDVEMIWTFTMVEGTWKVSDIDEGDMSLAYASQMKLVPSIESTVVERFSA